MENITSVVLTDGTIVNTYPGPLNGTLVARAFTELGHQIAILEAARATSPAPVADSGVSDALPARNAGLIQDLKDEQTYLASCRERCSEDDEGPRWDRLQRVIDHLDAAPEALPEAEPVATPEGWQLVPKRADDAMMLAAWKVWEAPGDRQHNVWKAMLAASPPAPASEPIARDVLFEVKPTLRKYSFPELSLREALDNYYRRDGICEDDRKELIAEYFAAILEAAREGKS